MTGAGDAVTLLQYLDYVLKRNFGRYQQHQQMVEQVGDLTRQCFPVASNCINHRLYGLLTHFLGNFWHALFKERNSVRSRRPLRKLLTLDYQTLEPSNETHRNSGRNKLVGLLKAAGSTTMAGRTGRRGSYQNGISITVDMKTFNQ